MSGEPTGWTGGQWSLVRLVLGLTLAAHLGTLAATETAPLGWLASAAALALAIGWRTRPALITLLVLTVLFVRAGLSWLLVAVTLAAVAGVPNAPYGSLEARGRTDPAGGWTVPHRIAMAAWILLAAVAVDRGIRLAAGSSGLTAALGLAYLAGAVLAVGGGARLGTWLALTGLGLVALPLVAEPHGHVTTLGMHALAFRPAWVPAMRPQAPLLLFYDGACGLCHRTVRFLLSEDRGAAVHFAPLFGATFEARVPATVRATLPDSLVLLTADGTVLIRSRGAIETARALGGLWRALAELLTLVPTAALDGAYDTCIRARHRIFARPEGTCPLIPPSLRGRFPDLAAQGGEVGLDGTR